MKNQDHEIIMMRLYIGDNSERGRRMISRFQTLLQRRYGNSCNLELINVIDDPQRARKDNILATPTLIRLYPKPEFRVVGNLQNRARMMNIIDRIAQFLPDNCIDDHSRFSGIRGHA